MALSNVLICNMAMQKLGQARIVTLTEDTRQGRSCNACFEFLRDVELSAHNWNFAIKRGTLAPSATDPEFDFEYAFPVPNDYLRLIPPARHALDWTIESVADAPHILTNDGDTLEIRYVARITDPTKFHMLFAEALACKIADHVCEEMTQSNTKRTQINQDYKDAIARAKRTNAFEQTVPEEPEDPWLAARR